MRVAPLLLPHLRSGTADLWADVALASMLTHNDAGSTAACLALVGMLWQLLATAAPPPAEWWLDAYVSVARELEGETTYHSRPGAEPYAGPIWRLVKERVAGAYDRRLSVLDACRSWYSGAYLLETVPCVIYILMRHADDPEEAIVRAVNDTKDNDTVAAIVGAAVGALHGVSGLPERWRADLTGRTGANDDGRIFDLIDRARQWL
jgi:ADP-ribosylglycohydrolase